jgi:hypothetical protein
MVDWEARMGLTHSPQCLILSAVEADLASRLRSGGRWRFDALF